MWGGGCDSLVITSCTLKFCGVRTGCYDLGWQSLQSCNQIIMKSAIATLVNLIIEEKSRKVQDNTSKKINFLASTVKIIEDYILLKS